MKKCNDPKVAAPMDGPDVPGVFDNPMDEAQGGHIHSCCAPDFLYWESGEFATLLEGMTSEEIGAIIPMLRGVKLGIAVLSFMEAVNDEEEENAVSIQQEKPQ